MHPTLRYISNNTKEDEAKRQNINVFLSNAAMPTQTTGLEDKPLLPSVFRPNSMLFAKPMNVIAKPNPDNNPTIAVIQNVASQPSLQNAVTPGGLINLDVSAIQNPVFSTRNSTDLQPVYNAFSQMPAQARVVHPGRDLPGFTQAGHGSLQPHNQVPHVIPAQNIARHPGNNLFANALEVYHHTPVQAYQRLSHQFTTPNATSYQFNDTHVKPISSGKQIIPTQGYMPKIHSETSTTYMSESQGDNPVSFNKALTSCSLFEEPRYVSEIDNETPLQSYVSDEQTKHLFDIDVVKRQSRNSDLLEPKEFSSKFNKPRPFFGEMKNSPDFMHSSSPAQKNTLLPNRAYTTNYREMRFDNNPSDVGRGVSGDNERFSYLETRVEKYFPEQNRTYQDDSSSTYDKFDRDEPERPHTADAGHIDSYEGLENLRYLDSIEVPYLSTHDTRHKSPARYESIGNSRGHSPCSRDRRDSHDRVSEDRSSVDRQSFSKRVRSRSRSPIKRHKNSLSRRSWDGMRRPKSQHGNSHEKDKFGNYERRRSPPRRSSGSQCSSREREKRDIVSPHRKSGSSSSDRRNKRSERWCFESRGKSEKMERLSSKQSRNNNNKSTSRALKCYCLPEPYTPRTFVYQQSSRYYQASLSSQKSTSTATDNVAKLHEEFEEMISKSRTVEDCPSTSSFKDTVQNSEEDTQYVSELLENVDDEDNDVSSESDVDLQGYDVIDEYDTDSSNDDTTVSLKGRKFRNQEHPRKLHSEMWFNVQGELNHGQECLCSLKDKKKWIVHSVYPNEQFPKACEAMGNNGLQLYHYWVTVFPHPNFMTENPTTIEYNGRTYTFEGFSLLSHSPLDDVPRCFLTRFNFKYEIFFIQEPIPTNFCIKDLDLLSKFLFHDILEMYDWKMNEEDEDSCNLFHFLPRFTYRTTVFDDGSEMYELLSMRMVFEHLIKSRKPLITENVLKSDRSSWKDFVASCVNSIATRPDWKPSSIRIDDVERDKEKEHGNPVIVHHGIRPVELSFSGDPKCQKLMKKYLKMRTLLTNKPDVSQKERLQLIKMKLTLDNMKMKDSLRRNCCVRVDSSGVMKTGLNSDITQHALLLPVLVHHVRYHLSLQTFDEKIGYVFKDRSLLQLALTHPSYVMNFGTNADHARNTLSNCGVKQPRYGDRRNRLIHTKKKGIVQLIDIMAKLEDLDGSQSFIQHNERLEFLGDAILEFICTCHLYFLFPGMTEGELVTHRSSLVQNKHLAQVAQKLGLENFMQFSHGPDLCHQEDMQHALANCLEALLGAIYLDSDVSTVQKVFCKLVFEEVEYRKLWCSLPRHPLQEQQPEGDRQFISSSDVLKRLVKFEEAVGVQFKHIRLLARAFTHPQVGYNNLTLGNNQRMELLGDSLVQWVVTDYLYHHFPEHHEGHLTLLRSSLVNRTIQAQIAGEIGLDQHVYFGVGPCVPKLRQKHMSDLFEAFLAALFVDKGIEPVEIFCKVCLFPRLRRVIVNQEWMDAKSQLQSCCLTQSTHSGNVPVYKVLKNVGSPNMKLYKVGVYFNSKRLATGFGDSIREAEMNAAQNALATNYFPEYARQKRVVRRKHTGSKRVRPEAK